MTMVYRPFSTLLVANRGEIARRILRAARSLGLRTVAVHGAADRDAAFVAEADVAVEIGDEADGIPYLRSDAVLDAARRSGADAVHPGYGFLAERASFALDVLDAGLVWVGPPPAVMAAMGDKDAAKAQARAAGVPVVPGVEGRGLGDDALAALALAEVGAPCLVKAAAGGGGRGMRLIARPDALAQALTEARWEAERAFGDGTLLVERYIAHGRHIEVQVLADAHGHVVHLHERDCSLQRRHQKLLEEAPAPGLAPALRAALHDDAVRLARQIGYVSAGTFEFLIDVERGSHHFLEVNARIQVEHPVSELITGVDLVAWQLRVAMGEALTLRQGDLVPRGHAVEVRLCAEDPAAGFAPQAGAVATFAVEDRGAAGVIDGALRDGLRVDAALEPAIAGGAGAVPIHYDSMVAKLVAWAPTRPLALARLRRALDHTRLWGPRHNGAWLRAVLGHPAVQAGGVTTAFVAAQGPVDAPAGLDVVPDEALLALTVWRHHEALRRRFRSNAHRPDVTVLLAAEGDGGAIHVALLHQGGDRFAGAVVRSPDPALLEPLPPLQPLRLVAVRADTIRLQVGGVTRTTWCGSDGERLWLQWPQGVATALREGTLLPWPAPAQSATGAVVAASPAIVVAVHVEAGQRVAAGDALITLEAMKMLSVLRAERDGVVTDVAVQAGASVAAGVQLVTIAAEPMDP